MSSIAKTAPSHWQREGGQYHSKGLGTPSRRVSISVCTQGPVSRIEEGLHKDFIPIRNENARVAFQVTPLSCCASAEVRIEGSSPVYCNCRYSVSMVAVVSVPVLLLANAFLAARGSAFVSDPRRLQRHRFLQLDLRLDAVSSGAGGFLGFIGGGSTKVPRNGSEKYVVGLVRQSVSSVFGLKCRSATVCSLNSARCETEINKLSRQ
jgi:hypothetical protein